MIAFASGDATMDLDLVVASGGFPDQAEPYEAIVDLEGASVGDVVTILVRGGTGLEGDTGEFAAVALVVGTGLPATR